MKIPNVFWDIVGQKIDTSKNPLIKGELVSINTFNVDYYIIGVSQKGLVFVVPNGISENIRQFTQFRLQKNIYMISIQEFMKLNNYYVECYTQPIKVDTAMTLNESAMQQLKQA